MGRTTDRAHEQVDAAEGFQSAVGEHGDGLLGVH